MQNTHPELQRGTDASNGELRNTASCRVWGWKPWRTEPDFAGLYPKPSQAVRDACLANGVLAWGDDTDVVIVLPPQYHAPREEAQEAEEA